MRPAGGDYLALCTAYGRRDEKKDAAADGGGSTPDLLEKPRGRAGSGKWIQCSEEFGKAGFGRSRRDGWIFCSFRNFCSRFGALGQPSACAGSGAARKWSCFGRKEGQGLEGSGRSDAGKGSGRKFKPGPEERRLGKEQPFRGGKILFSEAL